MSCHSSSSSSSEASLPKSSSSRGRRPAQDMRRSQSLRLPTASGSKQHLHMPIPPSLRQSPLLNSPRSIFKRSVSTPQPPSDEDEHWLQDTIPVSSDEAGPRRQGTTSSPVSRTGSLPSGQRAAALRSIGAPALPSPPLVRVRSTTDHTRSRLVYPGKTSDSESNRQADGYFDLQSV